MLLQITLQRHTLWYGSSPVLGLGLMSSKHLAPYRYTTTSPTMGGATGHTPSSLLGGLHPAGITAGVPLASFPGSCGGGEEGRVWCPSHYSPPPQEPGNEARAPIRLQVEQLAQGTEEERADCHADSKGPTRAEAS